MNPVVADQLMELNRRFYSERGRDFSETRQRIQPGVGRIIERLGGNESILDLGCGNGSLARELSRRGHQGRYLGVDDSDVLLQAASDTRYTFPVRFIRADVTDPSTVQAFAGTEMADGKHEEHGQVAGPRKWSVITAFAVLHHVPGIERRLALLHGIRSWLEPGGIFVHSNWQLSASRRLLKRVQPWSTLGLEGQTDEGDRLVSWQRGGHAYRYVHEFNHEELERLAQETGFVLRDDFYSDGADGRSALYQVWVGI